MADKQQTPAQIARRYGRGHPVAGDITVARVELWALAVDYLLVQSALAAASAQLARVREFVEEEHYRWGQNVGALGEPAEYGARRALEAVLSKLSEIAPAAPATGGGEHG